MPARAIIHRPPGRRNDQPIEQVLAAVREPTAELFREYQVPEDDAQDLLQESLTALVFKWEAVHNPVAWLLATLRNRCESYRRQALALRRQLEEAKSRASTGGGDDGAGLHLAELRHDLNAAVARLPSNYQHLLRLRYGLGCTGAEVAEQLGRGCDGVRRDLTTCLTLLARELEAGGFDA